MAQSGETGNAMQAGAKGSSSHATIDQTASGLHATHPADRKSSQPTTLAVRFKSTIEEIGAQEEGSSARTTGRISDGQGLGDPTNLTNEQLRDLSNTLKTAACPLQERRMGIFQYEPFSLPPSRTASNEDSSRDESRATSRQATQSSTRLSPSIAPTRNAEMSTPPLTPLGSNRWMKHTEMLARTAEKIAQIDKIAHLRGTITPQEQGHRPTSTSSQLARPRSADSREPRSMLGDHRKGMFTAGGSPTSSMPVSRDSSPSRPASQFYSRDPVPSGDANDPYAAHKRQAQTGIDSRFKFSRKKKPGSPSLSATSMHKPASEKRHSTANAGGQTLGNDEAHSHSRQSSMADLMKFFKLGQGKNRSASPARSGRSSLKNSRSSAQIPFGDDHGLTSKYGKLGRVLGSGAAGSVRLMKRAEDGTVFAVKEFRSRHTYETERDYIKKLTAEYCMGSSLHHGNVIETLDIVQEKGKWYEVMEYAPYDLFAIVMTGKMTREEVTCCFLQILSGVTYLHSLGLAHRDLKLDNVVVSDRGIMKIIDFGSAHVFKYPFENGMVLASGIVGSDPYLAPEVYTEHKYDPRAVDIWSLAIIYCCMTLRRFPWKIPRMTDGSFKLFASDHTPGHDPQKLVLPPSKFMTALDTSAERGTEPQSEPSKPKAQSAEALQGTGNETSANTGSSSNTTGERKEIIRGPWRILRLLPRESRYVISRMLELDPKKRARMDEILEDPWVADTVICRQIEPGVVVNADDHAHVLEPPAPASK